MTFSGTLSLVALLSLFNSDSGIGIGPECPTEALSGPINDPSHWADQCFSRTTGRVPERSNGEKLSRRRDIDLDGKLELLEVRGSGQSVKQIYVFRELDGEFRYMGLLSAHPSFEIRKSEDGKVEYVYFHGVGLEDGFQVVLRYIDGGFKVVSRTQVGGDT